MCDSQPLLLAHRSKILGAKHDYQQTYDSNPTIAVRVSFRMGHALNLPLTMRLLMLHLSYKDPWLDATRHLACCSCHCRAKSLIEQLAHERRAPIS